MAPGLPPWRCSVKVADPPSATVAWSASIRTPMKLLRIWTVASCGVPTVYCGPYPAFRWVVRAVVGVVQDIAVASPKGAHVQQAVEFYGEARLSRRDVPFGKRGIG